MLRSLVVALLTTVMPASAPDHLVRADWDIPGGAGTLHVREVRLDSAKRARPVILVHGARVPGVASFDLPVAGGSLAEDLAREGRRVIVMDATGYGGSTRPPAMTEPPEANPPVVTGEQAVKDIEAVVRWLRSGRVDLVGWATGGHWAAWYASEYPHRVANLVVHSSLYGATVGHPLFGGPPPSGAYRLSTGAQLLPAWDSSIPVPDKTEWRDPRVAQSYVDAALASDPTSADREPPSFRAPTGAMADSHRLANGTQLWDAHRIRARTLVLRAEYDFWSRPADLTALAGDLTAAREVRAVTLEGATHHVHLDRPGKGRTRFIEEVTGWLR
ncbi:alpha/beta fold hydrolase [Amycolatopsis sp. EV170708-02-1]|uniref:alpha/beta fold hydrolase n=1 Tax=Amycolatopsis sp. EV170708-02-1 TaxID=2919322 RepID=UPI001F0BE9E6|nr:alpha/beta fold hydrolase [Amycolatopsis sp. EV170708-02-1]UMP00103.1 alpha/beta hydrolase [Amycolatopsis sp. EV170708-02-1]